MKPLATIAALMIAALAWIALQSPPPRPNISVTFLGYTNTSAGSRLAMFGITNQSAAAVARAFPYTIQIASPSGWKREPGSLLPRSAELEPGASEVISIAPPTNRCPWKASIVVTPGVGTLGRIKWMGTIALWSIGLPTRYGYRLMRYEIDSDMVDEAGASVKTREDR